MKFRSFFNEIQHVSLPEVMRINGIPVDAIDFRFEDWKQGYNPEKERQTLMPSVSGQRFFAAPTFSASLGNGSWLNINQQQQRTMGSLGLKLAAQPEPVAQITPVALYRPLPEFWIDFAIFYHGNNVTKAPEWPRGPYELLRQDLHASVGH